MGYCVWCKKESDRTFCSSECEHQYKFVTYPAYAKKIIVERDKGKCQNCGLDCVELRKVLNSLPPDLRKMEAARFGISLKRLNGGGDLYDLDHKIQRKNGGLFLGEENLVTLCIACHKKKTAKENRERLKNSQ